MFDVVIDGIRPFEGRYTFEDVSALTTREWGWVKKFSGYLPLNFDEGLRDGDAELITSYAVIALVRAGKVDKYDAPDVYERLIDGEFGTKITLAARKVEEEEGKESGPPLRNSNENDGSSGPDSTRSSEISLVRPNLSGTPDSDSSASDQRTSAI